VVRFKPTEFLPLNALRVEALASTSVLIASSESARVPAHQVRDISSLTPFSFAGSARRPPSSAAFIETTGESAVFKTSRRAPDERVCLSGCALRVVALGKFHLIFSRFGLPALF